MDNDKKLVQKLKNRIKTAKFNWDYRNYSVAPRTEGNRMIAEIITAGKPAMVARCGATEMRCVAEYLAGRPFSEKISRQMSDLSGFFPSTQANLERFCELYMECVSHADIMALWGVGAEAKVVKTRCKPDTRYTRLVALEPFFFDDPWSRELKGKKVLVVHPFTDTIRSQYAKRELLWKNPDILPQFDSLELVQAVQSLGGGAPGYDSWFHALESMKQKIAQTDFDVAIIGAGAYGLPLTAYVKELGKVGVQISGGTQMLFGIKGKRWDENPKMNIFYNEAWVRPSAEETPKSARAVEGGSYW